MCSHKRLYYASQNYFTPSVCRWRCFLSPNIIRPNDEPFSPWEIAVIVLVRLAAVDAAAAKHKQRTTAVKAAGFKSQQQSCLHVD